MDKIKIISEFADIVLAVKQRLPLLDHATIADVLIGATGKSVPLVPEAEILRVGMLDDMSNTAITTAIAEMLMDKNEPTAVPLEYNAKAVKLYMELYTKFVPAISDKFKAETVKVYLQDEKHLDFYLLFLYLFPHDKDNALWDINFNTTYENVNLRLRSKGTAAKFEAAIAKRDPYIYLIGVYLCIKNSITPTGKTFVKKMENFFKEHLNWYKEAEQLLTQEQVKATLFERTGTIHVVI
jgi:hypothetical protein